MPISKAKTLLRYVGVKTNSVTFDRGVDVEVFSKRQNDWGIKVSYRIMHHSYHLIHSTNFGSQNAVTKNTSFSFNVSRLEINLVMPQLHF